MTRRLPILLLCLVLLAGCSASNSEPLQTTQAPPVNPTTPGGLISNTDPCAMRLHDISGSFVAFIAFRNRLPETLEELNEVQIIGPLPPLVCPASGKPYVYRPDGFFLAEQGEQVILHDPEPSHSGVRLAVTIRDGEAANVVTDVVPLPERLFLGGAGQP